MRGRTLTVGVKGSIPMTSNKLLSYFTIHFAFFVFSLAVLSMKYASTFPYASVQFLKYYILCLFLLVVYAFFWQRVLAISPLTRAYSWRSVVFVWVFLFSVLFFEETLTWKNLVGTFLIIMGCIVVNRDE